MNFIKLKIGIEGDAEFTAKLKRAEASANEFINALKVGVGIDLGGKLVASIQAIPTILQEAVSRGVAYNRTLADSEVAIANVVSKFRNLDAVASKQEAAKAIAKIKEIEPEAAGTLQTLIAGFMATYASSAQAGVSIEQNVELVGMMANALANANIPAEQLSQELRAIFTGNIGPDAALGKLLEIKPADLEAAKTAGKLYDFLVEKVGTLGKAGDTSAVKLSSLSSAFDAALGDLTKPVQLALDTAVAQLTEDLKNMPREELQALGEDLAELVASGADLTRWIVQNTGTLIPWAAAIGKVAAAWALLKITDLVLGLASLALKLTASSAATTAETVAVAANTKAWQANAAARVGAAGAGVAGAARIGTMMNVGALLGMAVKTTIDSFTADMNAESDQREASTRAKLEQKFGRPGGPAGGRAGNGPAQVKLGDEPIDMLSGTGPTDADLAAARMAGLGGDELWAAKMAQAGDRRGQLGSALGLGEGFSIDDAFGKATQSGTPQQQDEVVASIKELAGWEKEIAEMQDESAEAAKESADEAGKRMAARERELATMGEQAAIAEAELKGNERLKIELEAQLHARQLMEKLTDMGVPAAQAEAEAERTAGLQRDLALQDLSEKEAKKSGELADLKPSFGDELTTRGGRGARQRRGAREDFERKVRGKTSDPAEIAAKLGEYDQARLDEQGRGGTTKRSGLDILDGRSNLGGGPSADFEKAFGKRPPNFGDAVPTSPANAEAVPGGGAEADALRTAGQQADKLQGALDAAAKGVQSLNATVARVAQTLQNSASAAQGLDAAITDHDGRISALENSRGT